MRESLIYKYLNNEVSEKLEINSFLFQRIASHIWMFKTPLINLLICEYLDCEASEKQKTNAFLNSIYQPNSIN